MILPQYEAVFIHIPKTGGQSIENFLLKSLQKTKKEDGAAFLLMKNKDPFLGPERLAHLTADEYIKYGYITTFQSESWFKFSFTRNPWDRILSFYKFLGFSNVISFNNFILYYLPEYFEQKQWFLKNQTDFIYNKKEMLLVDYLGKFESLEKDFFNVAQKLSINYLKLPKNNRSIEKGLVSKKSFNLIKRHPGLLFQLNLNSRNTKDYRNVFNEASRKVVYELYEKDMDLLKYSF